MPCAREVHLSTYDSEFIPKLRNGNDRMSVSNRYILISPCRNEAAFMRQTIESVLAQSVRPSQWIIVDDGSTDATAEILRGYAAQHAWIRVVSRPDRGKRSVGPGVIEAFYSGYA